MRQRRMFLAAAVIVLMIAAASAALLAFDVNRHRGAIEAAASDFLGRDVSLGAMRLQLLPPSIAVRNATIGDDPRFHAGQPFARADELSIVVQPLALVRRRLQVRAMRLSRPSIELIRTSSGAWNFTSLGGRTTGSGAGLPLLEITGGRIAVTDMLRQQPRTLYENVDLELRDFAPARPFRILLRATLPGSGRARLVLDGTAGPLRETVLHSSFRGTLELDEVRLSALRRFLLQAPLEGSDATISGRARLASNEGRASAAASVRLRDAQVRTVDLGYAIAADVDVAYDWSRAQLTFASARLRLGDTPLSLTGTLDLQPDAPAMDMRIAATDVSLEAAARLAAAAGMAFGVDTTVAGRLDADVRARGALRRPALEGWARLRDVAISAARMRGTVRTPALELTLTPHEIRTGDVSATTNGTAVSGRLAVADYTGSPSIDVTVRAQDASVGDLLDVGRAWGVRAVERVAGTGRATLDIRVRGPAGGRTWDGRATLAESTIEASAVGTPVRVDRAVATFSRDAATVEPFAASVGRTRATGRLILRHLATPAAEFDISADRIDVAELRRLAAPATRTGDAAGRDGILQRATGIGRLRVGALENGELRLDDVDAAVVLDRGLIRLDPLSASLYGGQHHGAVSIDARGAATAFATRSRLEGVDASRLLAAVSGVRDVVHGSLTSDAAVSFATDGTANMAKSLNGTFSLNVADARIANIDLWNAVESIGRFVPRARPASSRQTASVSGTFRVDAGVARTDDLTATLEGAILGAAGAIDLSDHRLDFRVAAVLSADNSRRVATTGLGGLMATVLGNDRGELVVPLTITGTMEHPLFAPDLPRLAEMKLRRRAPTFASPGDLTADILGHLGNAGAETPTRLLDDLLEALAGRGARRMPQAPVGAQPPPPKQAAPREQPGDPARAIEDALRRLLDGRKPK